MSLYTPGFQGKDFREVVYNFSVEKLEPGEATQIALWTKSAAKELQQARSDWKGWLVTRFYETTFGNDLRKTINFFVEIWRCITEFRTIRSSNVWNKPNPQYFKINLNDGTYAYYKREVAFRLGYRHILATVPLHRVNGQIELNPNNVLNPLQKRRLELLRSMLLERALNNIRYIEVMDENLKSVADQYAYLKNLSFYHEDSVPTIHRDTFIQYRDELARLLNDYDFINPNKESDFQKYLEITSFIDQSSKDIPIDELSKETKEVIDIAGRIDAVARSNIKVNRRTFIALITGIEMLPERVVPKAKFFNTRATKVAQIHLRLATSAYIRSLLENAPPNTKEEIREKLRAFMIDERLYGLKRNAFIWRLKQEYEMESKALSIDQDLLDVDSDSIGVLTSISQLLGLKIQDRLDPVTLFELFMQLGFLKDPQVIEKRHEIRSFIDSYFKFRDKNPSATALINKNYQGSLENNVWEVQEDNRLRYILTNTHVPFTKNTTFANCLLPNQLLERAINYCENPSILRIPTLKNLSKILRENMDWQKKRIYSLTKQKEDEEELQILQKRLHTCTKALDNINKEFKIRGEISTIKLSPTGELVDIFAKHQTDLFKIYQVLKIRGINAFKLDRELMSQIPHLIHETTDCLHKVKRRIIEAASDVERDNLEEQLHVLKEHLWVLNLFHPPWIDKLSQIEGIIQRTDSGIDNSLTNYYSLQDEILKHAPHSISKAPPSRNNLLELIWNVLDIEVEELPMVAQKFVEEIQDQSAFFKRMEFLAAKRPDAFYRPTDLNKIEQMLEYFVPFQNRLNQLLNQEKVFSENNLWLRNDANTLNNSIASLKAAKDVIKRHKALLEMRRKV